jgi:8-hydroxy-5-deazaflavin:NADPH oxidoreductase
LQTVDIGIIGSGNIGATAAGLFAGAGHRVAISNSRGPESLGDLVEELDGDVRAATAPEAAEFGEVVLEAIPFGRYTELPAGELSGKVLISASNYYPARDGEMDLGDFTSSEVLAQHLTGARIVKAFNTMYYERLRDEGRLDLPAGERLAIFIAGDDEGAKGVVARLIEEIGFTPIDTGSLRDGGRMQEPGSPIYNVPLTGDEAWERLGEGTAR